MRSVVVLPHPDGPTITVILPEGTVRLRSTTATVPSRYVLPTDSNSITPTPQVSPYSLYDPSRHHRQLRQTGRCRTHDPRLPIEKPELHLLQSRGAAAPCRSRPDRGTARQHHHQNGAADRRLVRYRRTRRGAPTSPHSACLDRSRRPGSGVRWCVLGVVCGLGDCR